jgi:lipoprotein-releasing system permease protein
VILSSHERLIVRRYLLPGKGDRVILLAAAISMLAVTLAVAALVVVTSVINGFHGYLFDKIVATTDHAVIRGGGGVLPDWRRIAGQARQTPGVVSARPLVEGQLMLSARGAVMPALLRGAPLDDLASPVMRQSLVAGRLELGRGGEVVLGAGLAERVRIMPGETIELNRVTEVDGEVEVRSTAYMVAGVVETGVPDLDSAAVLMPLGDTVTSIAIRTAQADTVDLTVAPLVPLIPAGATLRTWKTLNASLFEALALDEVGMFVVLSIILLVGAFNILSSLVLLVRAKTRDIAILRTMGASSGSMLRIFVTVGSVIGGLGTGIGLLLGLLFLQFRQAVGTAVHDATAPTASVTSTFLVGLPARIEPFELAGVILFSMLLSFLATLYPAFTAARTDPVAVLRKG